MAECDEWAKIRSSGDIHLDVKPKGGEFVIAEQ
jgi:hypothetical protein